MIWSITGKWETPEEKCWAMFYWNHIARRQTTPMQLHGMALTDPIRQFNDYGYAMCSTISGINCSIWDAMGLKARYWDISNHTVSEVEYGGGWHMYDNSMSAIYTLCDGKTIAAVSDIGQSLGCEASEGRVEPGHVAKYHCLMGTSPRGFLTGADTIRSLDKEYRCFNPNGLKYRSYFYDWDRGHRYILNLRENESYTRQYKPLGNSVEFYVPNNGKDPEAVNTRYRIRGNGEWEFQPQLEPGIFTQYLHAQSGIKAVAGKGLVAEKPGQKGEAVFKVNGANVITSLKLAGSIAGSRSKDGASIAVSTSHGLTWKEVWRSGGIGEEKAELTLVEEVNGAYEVLVKVSLLGEQKDSMPSLKQIAFTTRTMLNSKTQPQLKLGKNTIYVGAGEQSESIVVWPDLRGEKYKPHVVEERNIRTAKEHPGYMGVMFAEKPGVPGHVVFRVDAPREITSVTYGGRLYNRAPGAHIDFLHSFDEGKTWVQSYSLTNRAQPWDVIRYETIKSVPTGTRSVLFKYVLEAEEAGAAAVSLYAVRMEVNHRPATAEFKPMEVTFNWSERQEDYTVVERSHTEIVAKLPHRFTINVAGADHPVMNSLRLSLGGEPTVKVAGIRQDKGEKFVPKWVSYGKNLAAGKKYTVSVPSNDQWGAGDPEGKKLTDAIVGPPYAGGTAPTFALCWNKGQEAVITVDLGEVQECAAFRIHVGAGWPWWDALKGEIKDKVELHTSTDGSNFTSHGFFNFNLRWKDLPVNHFWPDEEVIAGHNFELVPSRPVTAKFVRYRVQPERSVIVSEVEALASRETKPFDLRLALPDER